MPQLLSNLPVGTRVKDTTTKYYGAPIVWRIAGKNHSGYPANSVTLITDKIVAIKCFDGKEAANTDADRKNYGNNRYIYANLRKWLNSPAGAGAWYAAQHSADAPPNATNASNNPYENEVGFLNAFSANFVNSILTTTLTVARNTVTDGGGSETLTDKIFCASNTEVGLANENSIAEGAKLELFSDNASRIAMPTTEAVSNSTYTSTSLADSKAWYYWLRTPYSSNSYYVRYVNSSGTLGYDGAFGGVNGVRPLCNLVSSILVSDTTDTDGAYTIVWNRPPNPPTGITIPAQAYSAVGTLQIGWSATTDPDGDAVSYILERSANSGSWTQIYSGSNTTYTDNITAAMNTLQYRVKAVDTFNEPSNYTTSATTPVIHNLPPQISGTDGSLGVKAENCTYNYSVTDPENEATTVIEQINNKTLRTYTVQLGQQNIVAVDGNNWVELTQGLHTLTITATDKYNAQAIRKMTFTKQVNKLYVALAEPMEASTKPIRINVNIIAEVPAGAVLKVEACNNAYDPAPTWEDATAATIAHHAYVFANTLKQADNWGVNIRVNLERRTALGECYISAIGGNFE